jgi:hypothetical protein
MNPLSPNQILRNLENGYFMTHAEQEEAAVYIRSLQSKIRGALSALQTGKALDAVAAIEILRSAE